MSELASLREGYRAVVFGASGGIGAALVGQLAGDPRCANVHAGARRLLAGGGRVIPFQFDLLDEASIAAAVGGLGAEGASVDLVVVATGVLHNDRLTPEKSMRALTGESLAESFALNAIGPALIAKHVSPLLLREGKSVFAALSARVGSITDNHKGGWYAYRASKAALNQMIRTNAIELAVRNKAAVCVTLHPGTVDTPMSRPFRAGIAAGQIVSPEDSARNLLGVIDGLSPGESGGFYAWDGARIPF